jgi:uncharacterized protein DUF3667
MPANGALSIITRNTEPTLTWTTWAAITTMHTFFMTSSATGLTSCTNCRATLGGPFCAQCGQKVAALNPSFGEFLHELFHEFLHFDGKIVQSVRQLLIAPGFLSREHFEGRRARYVSPIRLYLIFSVLYFAVAALAPEAGFRVTWTPGPNDNPAEKPLREQAMREVISHWLPRTMFVLVPVFAGLVALSARRSGRNYPQHLYFALHVHAAWFFAGVVAALGRLAATPYLTPLIGALVTLYSVVYFPLALRRAYDAKPRSAILRAVVVGGTYAVIALATVLAIVFPAITSADATLSGAP